SRLAFSPDGELLVRVLQRDLRVFDARTGRPRCAIELAKDASGVAFFPRGTRFAVFAGDRRVNLFDARTGVWVSAVETEVPADALSPAGDHFRGTDYPSCVLMDAATGRVTARVRTDNLFDPAYAFAPDERRLYAFVPRGFLFVYDAGTGRPVEELLRPPGWKLYPGLVGLALSPDGRVAYLSQKGQATCRRDLVNARWLDPLPVMAGGQLVPHPDGKRLLLIGTDGVLHRYDLTTLKELPGPDGFAGYLTAVPSPDGRRVATLSGDESPRIDMFDSSGRRLWSDDSLTRWPTLHWTPNGDRLVTLTSDGLAFRDPGTGKLDRVLELPRGAEAYCGVVAFPPGSRQVLVPFNHGEQVAVVDLETRRPPTVLATKGGGKPAVSPDGRTLGIARLRAPPALVDLPTGKGRPRPDDPPDTVPSEYGDVAFSPDGDYLLSWEATGVALLRDPITGKSKRRIAIGDRWPSAFGFSPDGLWLATGSADGMVALWDVTTGHPVWTRDGHRGTVVSVGFAGPGRLVSASEDRTVLLWDLKADRGPTRPLWDALSGNDGLEVYAAIWALAADPDGPRFLREKVVASKLPAEQVRRWLADLDADRYTVREAASRALRDQGRLVAPELRAELAVTRAEEKRARLAALVARLTPERTGT
ncbi:MAG: WD40 repeat domain-containing protein, partial [Zavarzinella sp.]|nr:WD40 repeat domain-containing protein [Zavarzinella sp.]